MKLMRQLAAANYIKTLGGSITKQGINVWASEVPLPSFFHFSEKEKVLLVDVDDKEFQKRCLRNAVKKKARLTKAKLKGATGVESPPPSSPEAGEPRDIESMETRAYLADLQAKVYTAQIKEEQAKQEELKTAQMKKELAPMSLMKYYFSFAERIVQRSYRRVEEISPELESLFLAGKKKDAVKLLLREQETIANEASRELLKEIQEEGLKYDERK